MDKRPALLITVDTEGDNIWSRPDPVTTENSRYIPRFQALCEKYSLKPTYLTNFEMATCGRFVEFGRDALRRCVAEIGMHLHAWNSPPVRSSAASREMPYLIEFPETEIADKVSFLTDLLERQFDMKMTSHRAGRWAFNETYARILIDKGYRIDCSVTPNVSWVHVKGLANGAGGTDYREYPTEPYFVDPDCIGRRGRSPLLELPMTIVAEGSTPGRLARSLAAVFPQPVQKAVARVFPAVSWFRPNGRNITRLCRMLEERKHSTYIEFMLHSSELMPGGSPGFRDEGSIERLYEHLEALFSEAKGIYRGATLSEFRNELDPQNSLPIDEAQAKLNA